jgi:sugar/nucleoside kinase (ribokinase family)
MLGLPGLEPVDYLVVGHLTKDLTPLGPQLGGTAAYAGRTAHALGLRVGIVTAWGEDAPAELLDGIPILNHFSQPSTTFENRQTPQGRVQILHHIAPALEYYHIPELWRSAPMLHLAPVVHEVNPGIARFFPSAQVLLTPQGWLRAWDEQGLVHNADWPEARHALSLADLVVLSQDDLGNDPARIDEMAQAARLLVVTRGAGGASLYLEGREHLLPAPSVKVKDETGAGDVFAAAFFVRFNDTQDPLDAVNYANQVAADSVTRSGLAGAPSREDLYNITIEVN